MHFFAFLLLPALFSTSEGVSIGHRHHHKRMSPFSCPPVLEAHRYSRHYPTRCAFLDVTTVSRFIHDTQRSTYEVQKLSSAQPSAAPTAPAGQNSGSTVSNSSFSDAVFPCGRGLQSWTTLEGAGGALPISDTTFRPTKDIKTLTHNTVMSPGPNAKPAMEAVFPQGSWSLRPGSVGGFSFYAPGPQGVDLTIAKEATFGYSVMFENGWQWNMGGKLPGFCEPFFVSSPPILMWHKTVEIMIRSRLLAPVVSTRAVAGLRD
jgi:hypothetical protein